MEGSICMNPDCRYFSEAYLYENLSYNFMTGKYRDKKVEILLEQKNLYLRINVIC